VRLTLCFFRSDSLLVSLGQTHSLFLRISLSPCFFRADSLLVSLGQTHSLCP
ncbi:hypothetical protein GBAR_LOCUS15, partial [Geodia barretti]